MTDQVSRSNAKIDHGFFGRRVVGIWNPAGAGARPALVAAAAVNCLIFAVASRFFGLPALPGFDGSILHQPSALAACITIAILLLITTLVGTVLAGAVRFEAGLFTAAIGLLAISIRCGTIQSVLFETGGGPSVYASLLLELLILSLFLGGLWILLVFLGRTMSIHLTAPPDMDDSDTSIVNCLTATLAQAIATGLLMMLLCQSYEKNQVLASMAISSILGSMIAYKYIAVRPSFWYWAGPLLLGVIGYALAVLGQDSQLSIGSPAGTFAALARPLPIDYAGAGTAGAILGYWMMRKRHPADN